MSSNRGKKKRLNLFEAIGVELEYMIVDRQSLEILPVADELIKEVTGDYRNTVDQGEVAWSNELVAHVIELKTNGPARSLDRLHHKFQEQVDIINRILESYHACLMPGAMHPWMNPYTETKLWPHEYNPIYEAYDRIFDCRGHGWANLQSTHVNLPFADDEQFEKLHAAIRILLPVLPGLAASSPIADGKATTYADYRMEMYRVNSRKIPSVTGHIVPEAVFTAEEYDREIFKRIYRDIAPHDPDSILQDEWLNSRGAIARFDRGSIEIRVLDIQENPLADMAVVRIVADTLNAMVEERFSSLEEQKSRDEKTLSEILLQVVKQGEQAELDQDYLQLFGVKSRSFTVHDLWKYLFDTLYSKREADQDEVLRTMREMLMYGTLSTRISQTLPETFTKQDLCKIYKKLCQNLSEGGLFRPDE